MVSNLKFIEFVAFILLVRTVEYSDSSFYRDNSRLKLHGGSTASRRAEFWLGTKCLAGVSRFGHHSNVANCNRLRGGQPEHAPPNGPQSVQLGVLRNLLDFSTSITNTSDSDGPKKLDPERIRWLQEAMNSLLENTTDVFRQSIEILRDPETDLESVGRKENALETIRDRVDHLDLAVGLDNMGGLRPTVSCLDSIHSSIRWRAADVIAVAVINHEKLQQVDLRSDLYPSYKKY